MKNNVTILQTLSELNGIRLFKFGEVLQSAKGLRFASNIRGDYIDTRDILPSVNKHNIKF